jgi:hypothetical protein
MCIIVQKYKSLHLLMTIQFLFLFCIPSLSQTKEKNDTLIKVKRGTFIQIRDSISFFSKDTLLSLPGSVKNVTDKKDEKNLLFLDSIKVKATRNAITRKLYDFVIVNPDTVLDKSITGTSEDVYKNFAGKRIRKIEIRRLNVFGVNINDPAAAADASKFENLLNKSHVNTNEKIIRKNLLFSSGDTISPLTLSDNERILRQLSYIDDARIIVVPISEEEADIIVLTKDIYSLGGDFNYKGLKEGSVSVFEKNIFGMGHEFGIEIPYNSEFTDSPGFGVNYNVNNIARSFIDLKVYYGNGFGKKTYGFDLSRDMVSSTTKYAGGISVKMMYGIYKFDTSTVAQTLNYNLQDYWLSRSFLLDRSTVSRIIIGARYTNNNVFERPEILPTSYYDLQKYRLFLGSIAFSVQKYYKTSLIYAYGRTEDIPYGGMLKITGGREFNEFKQRTYFGTELSFGRSVKALGYLYGSAGFSSYILNNHSEQGQLSLKFKYFSNLVTLGNLTIRNFVNAEYTRGFDRYSNEYLKFNKDNGFSGFRNDSVSGDQRLLVSLESVLFSPKVSYGFRFAFFWFTDFSILSGTNQVLGNGSSLSSIGIGTRIRNDNLIFQTIQIRLGFFPNFPEYSKISNLTISGEQLLRPKNFDPGPPAIIQYR